MPAGIRRYHSKIWYKDNPILGKDERGEETNTGRVKYGDNKTRWNELPYESIEVSGNNSASSLTSGTLAPERIANGSLSLAKLDTNVVTETELTTALDTLTPSTGSMIYRGAWISETTYSVGDVVRYVGNTFVALTSISNSTTPPVDGVVIYGDYSTDPFTDDVNSTRTTETGSTYYAFREDGVVADSWQSTGGQLRVTGLPQNGSAGVLVRETGSAHQYAAVTAVAGYSDDVGVVCRAHNAWTDGLVALIYRASELDLRVLNVPPTGQGASSYIPITVGSMGGKKLGLEVIGSTASIFIDDVKFSEVSVYEGTRTRAGVYGRLRSQTPAALDTLIVAPLTVGSDIWDKI